MPRRPTSERKLAEISAEVHDLYLNAEALLYDPIAREVRVPLVEGTRQGRRFLGLRWETGRGPGPSDQPTPDYVLVIGEAESMRIDDQADAGPWYDVNSVWFDPAEGQVRVECNIPVELHVSVTKLEVTVIAPP